MNKKENFPQNEPQTCEMNENELNENELENASGGASANAPGIVICTYCGKDDSFVWRNGYRFCTRCNKNFVDVPRRW